MIDLHTHSVFSDGSLMPETLAEKAAEMGLSALALTDHDTTAGVPQFLAACARCGIEGIPGVEISADFSPGTMHLLGFFVDPEAQSLQEALARLRTGREKRNRKIVEKLASLGMQLEWDAIKVLAGGDVVGRPHIAEAMVNCGYVNSRQKAFQRFLRRGAAAYEERYRLSPEVGITRICDAGGVPVLAHPFTLGLSFRKLRACVADLVEHGLAGIEVFYPEHGAERRSWYTELAKTFNLVMTGGSDFHGAANPAIALGRGFGNVFVSDSVLVALRERLLIGC